MERYTQSFDICIVCALYEEAEAVLNEFSMRRAVSFAKKFSRLDRYVYYHTIILNKQKEPLTVLVTWLPDSGPTQTGLDLKPFLHEFRPRFVAMTGICAGYKGKVRLGDLVVAEYAYAYEEGKIVRDPKEFSRHLPEMKTAGPTSQIIHYAQGFTGWKELVREMKRDKLKRSLKPAEEPRCVVAPMASGMAVRGDDPFPWLREKYDRNTLALDMEAATFYRALRAVPHIQALVVKGVCDYADMSKNDAYHDYAARTSAVYLLSFLQEYVTEQTMPRRDVSLSSSQAKLSPLWNIPYPRNPFFTGRERLLSRLRTQLQVGQPTALSQPQAISGLGGIGKTQIAIEYAYRYQYEYEYVLWARADTTEALTTAYIEIARLLQLPQKDAHEQKIIVEAVNVWLQTHQKWLLILDNADDLDLLSPFLPTAVRGHIVITTRTWDMQRLATRLEVEALSEEQGARLLLHRAGLLASETSLADVSPQDRKVAAWLTHELGGLPLALDQAGAYLEAVGMSLQEYQKLYQTHRQRLLQERRSRIPDHPDAVATTWSLSFQRVEEKDPAAADLLRLCAYFAPDAIAEEILTTDGSMLGSVLAPLASDTFRRNQAIEVLRTYSLIQRNPKDRTLSVHRLVQAVLQDELKEKERHMWAERAMLAINGAFPHAEYTTWAQCERLLMQALTGTQIIKEYQITRWEAGHLLYESASYLWSRARYAEAETLYQWALRIREQSLGPEHPDVASTLIGLANLYFNQMKYAEAETLYQRALHIWEQSLGPEHPDVASTLIGLANLCFNQMKYAEAELFHQRALHIWEQSLGPGHSDATYLFTDLADLYSKQDKYAEAELFHQRSLHILEQSQGLEHPHMASLLTDLANLYSKQDKYTEAEPLYQRAVRIRELSLGPEHPDVAYPLNGLAELYREQGKYAEAEPLYQRALRIREQSLGPEHSFTRHVRKNYALLLQTMGRDEEAKKLEEKS